MRAFVAPLLVLVLAGLTPLARLSPPDPTWFAGLWDDGGFQRVRSDERAIGWPTVRFEITF